MRTLAARTLASLGLATIVFACGGGGGGVPDTGLLRGDFRRIADGGIDDRINAYPWGVELFDGDRDGTPEIYIGTLANALCMQAGVVGLPPERWQCPNELWNEDDIRPYFLACLHPAVIFRGTYDPVTDDFTWDRVFEPPIDQVFGFRGAKVFKGALYMLGGTRLGTVWKSTTGTDWAPASPPSMAISGGFRGAVEFQDKLYIASDTVGQIYMSSDPSTAEASWQAANSRGFVASGGTTQPETAAEGTIGSATASTLTSDDVPLPQLTPLVSPWRVEITSGAAAGQVRPIVWHDGNTVLVERGGVGTPFSPVPVSGDSFRIHDPAVPDNGPCWQIGVFDDHLYASCVNPILGPMLWRSSDPAAGNWEQVFTQGYVRPGRSVYATMNEYKSKLYVGSLSYPLYYENGLDDAEACEVLRLDVDGHVEVLVGDERPAGTPGTNDGLPLSGEEAGWGQPTNLYVWRALSHDDGWYYAATCDFAGMLRDYADAGSDLIPPEYVGLIDLFVGPSGFDLYRTQDGLSWTTVTTSGFGEDDSYGIRNMLSTPWGMLVCVANAVDGFEVWLGRK